MFNFSTLITIIVAVIAIYLPLYFNFKKDIDDLTETSYESKKNKNKIISRKKRLNSLKIITLILILVFIILYKLPSILDVFASINLTNLWNFFTSLFPFKKDFFLNSNFKFSYITGIVLSVIIEVGLFCFIHFAILPIKFYEYIFEVILLIIVPYCLIWINKSISSLLKSSIINNFEILSIVINITSYIVIALIILIITFIIFYITSLFYINDIKSQ